MKAYCCLDASLLQLLKPSPLSATLATTRQHYRHTLAAAPSAPLALVVLLPQGLLKRSCSHQPMDSYNPGQLTSRRSSRLQPTLEMGMCSHVRSAQVSWAGCSLSV
jgi:hypothetical protein